MMSMHFPYENTNTARPPLYGTAVCPNFRVNYNHYYASFYPPNSNGLLPTPKLEGNQRVNLRQYPPSMSRNLSNHSSSSIPSILPYGNRNDFLTFLEQKANPMPGLNPFANEFSLVKQTVPVQNEFNSTYKPIFDDLIEQSLQSIDAIKKASKITPVTHVATQCEQTMNLVNRSTQTDDNQIDQLKQHSSRTIDLMNNLLEKFQSSFSNPNDVQHQLKSISSLLDELHYFILAINQNLLSNNSSSLDRDNLFSKMIKHLSFHSSPSQQIHPITMNRSKICLLCQRTVDDGDDVMHKLCRLLSSAPDTS